MRSVMVWCCVIVGAWIGMAEALRRSQAEGPVGAAVCADAIDNNLDTTVDAADAGCAAGDAFVAITGGFAAAASDLIRAPVAVWNIVTDASSPSGDYVQLPPGQHPFLAHLIGTGIGPGSYYIKAIVSIESSSETEWWWHVGTKPPIPPPQTLGGRINNGQVASGWIGVNVGSYDQIDGETGSKRGINTTPQKLFTVASGDQLFLFVSAGLKIACISLHTSATAMAECPTGGQAPLLDYLVYQYDTAPTVDGIEDSLWTETNALSFSGFDSGVQGTSTVRYLWKNGVPDRMCAFLKHTQANLTAVTSTDDSSAIFSDTSLDTRMKFADMVRVLDENSHALVVNGRTAGPAVLDRDYTGGSANAAFNFTNRSVAASYTANVMIIEACFDIPVDVTAGQTMLADAGVNERVSGLSIVTKLAHCQGSTIVFPDCWGVWGLSSTVIGPPGDTTPPTTGTVTVSSITSSSATVSWAVTDDMSSVMTCQAIYDTDDNGEVLTGSFAVVTGPNSVSGQCTVTLVGLAAGTAHEVIGRSCDSAGNCDDSNTITDFTTLASSGDTFYIAASGGSDANNCSSASRCNTLAGVMGKATFGPGDTVIFGNGTYNTGAGRTPNINCADAPTKFNGTSTARITLRAENERQAFIKAVDWSQNPFLMSNCAYWTIEGFHIEGGDFPPFNGNPQGHAVAIQSSNNFIFRYNLVRFNNRYKNGTIVNFSGSSAFLIEENEFYTFHRNGVGGGTGTYRRNYLNSRGHPDLNGCSGGSCSSHSKTMGDGGFVAYPSSNNLYENNVGEWTSEPFQVIADGNVFNNHYYGNIAIGPAWTGFGLGAKINTSSTGIGMRYVDSVAILFGDYGMRLEGGRDTVVQGATVTNSTVGQKSGILVKRKNSTTGTSPFSFAGENILSYNNLGTGVLMSSDTDWSIDSVNSVDNGTNYSPSSSSRYANKMTVTISHGTVICVPQSSAMANAGVGGRDIGANVLYRYNNRTLTSTPMWVKTKPVSCPANANGWYLNGMRECVSGVNDTAGNSLYDLALRLNITNTTLASCDPTYPGLP